VRHVGNIKCKEGRPEGIVLGDKDVSLRGTVKERPSRNALRVKRRYVGSLKTMSLERRPCIQTVS
jgi:hypothetical protein